jgi:hypothetical protein
MVVPQDDDKVAMTVLPVTTERKNAEEAQARLAAIMKSSVDAIISKRSTVS